MVNVALLDEGGKEIKSFQVQDWSYGDDRKLFLTPEDGSKITIFLGERITAVIRDSRAVQKR